VTTTSILLTLKRIFINAFGISIFCAAFRNLWRIQKKKKKKSESFRDTNQTFQARRPLEFYCGVFNYLYCRETPLYNVVAVTQCMWCEHSLVLLFHTHTQVNLLFTNVDSYHVCAWVSFWTKPHMLLVTYVFRFIPITLCRTIIEQKK
jgi:hypothetical protein